MILTQPDRPTIKKQTKVQRKSLNPEFDECFIFDISPKIEDLHYTSLTFIVYDHERLRSDEIIGKIHLGYQSSEKKEIQLWHQIMQHPGMEFENYHKIQPNNSVWLRSQMKWLTVMIVAFC